LLRDVGQRHIDDEQVEIGQHDAGANDGQDLARSRCRGHAASPASWYRLAACANDKFDPIARRASLNRDHSAMSGKEGIVTSSPMSRPASAASTISSASISLSAGIAATSTPA